MSNGNIFREIKEALKDDPGSITPETLNRLVLEGIIGLKEELDNRPVFSVESMKKLEKHELTLYGDSSVRGHEDRIQTLENKMNLLLWIIATVVTPILIAIGVGVIRIIQLGG